MSRREWEWEGMGMSYREQYGNGNGFFECANFGNGNGKDLAGIGGIGSTENHSRTCLVGTHDAVISVWGR